MWGRVLNGDAHSTATPGFASATTAAATELDRSDTIESDDALGLESLWTYTWWCTWWCTWRTWRRCLDRFFDVRGLPIRFEL